MSDECTPTPVPKLAEDRKPPRLSFTPGRWRFLAVGFSFITFLDDLGESVSVWTWAKAGLSALVFVLLAVTGHRPSKRRLW